MTQSTPQTALLKGASYAGMAEAVTRITRIVTAIALARMMSVEEFGIAAAALTVHELTRMFIQNGLGTRIVASSDTEVSAVAGTVYWLNLVLGVILFVVQVSVSVPVASYFGAESLVPAIIVLASVHLIYPFSMVQVYLAQRQNRWGLVSTVTATQSAIDNLLMAVLAVLGWGIWAVVVPKVVVAVIWTVWHYKATPWRDRARFDPGVARGLATYSIRILGVELLAALRLHADKAIVGAAFGPSALGLYAFAANIGNGITTSLSQSLGAVLLPFLRANNEAGTLRHSYVKSLGLLFAMALPLVALQAAFAPWYVIPVFGEKWAPAIPLLILLSVASLTKPAMVATSQMLRARNETSTDLRLGILTTILFFAGLVLGMASGGLFATAVGCSIGLLVGSVVAVWTGFRVTRSPVSQIAATPGARTLNDAEHAVSVVIACYNAERTIVDTIMSARSQTVANIEIIVVDDGSQDSSCKLVARLASEDDRVKLIEQSNAGPSAARNNGVHLARADVVAFLDSDDLWDPNHLALNLAALNADEQLGVSFGGARFMSADGRPVGRSTSLWNKAVALPDVLSSNPTATCSSLVVRKEVFANAGGFRSDMKYAEDQEWLFRVLVKGWRVRSVPHHTIQYRISQGGLSCQVDKMRAGWQQFIDHARDLDPLLVHRYLPRATAFMELYFADRNLAANGRIALPARCIARALRSWPPIVLTAPKRFLGSVYHLAALGLSRQNAIRSA